MVKYWERDSLKWQHVGVQMLLFSNIKDIFIIMSGGALITSLFNNRLLLSCETERETILEAKGKRPLIRGPSLLTVEIKGHNGTAGGFGC